MKIVLLFIVFCLTYDNRILSNSPKKDRQLTSGLQQHEGIEVYKFINYEYKTYIRDMFLSSMYKYLVKINEIEKLPEENIFIGTGDNYNLVLQNPKIAQVLQGKSLKQFMEEEALSAATKTVYNDVITKWTMYIKKNKEDTYAFFKASISFKEEYDPDVQGTYDGVIHIALENAAYSKKIQIYSTGRRNSYLRRFVERNVNEFFIVQRQIIQDFSSLQNDVEHLLKVEFSDSQFQLLQKYKDHLQIYDINQDESLKNSNIVLKQTVEDFDKVPEDIQYKDKLDFDEETNQQQISFYMVKLTAKQLTDEFEIYIKDSFRKLVQLDSVKLVIGQNFLCYRLFPLLEEFQNPTEIIFVLHQDKIYYQIQNEYVTMQKMTQQITYRAVIKILEKNIANFKKQYTFQKKFEKQQFTVLDQQSEDLTPFFQDFQGFIKQINEAQTIYDVKYTSATDLTPKKRIQKDYQFTYDFSLRIDDDDSNFDDDIGEMQDGIHSINESLNQGQLGAQQYLDDDENRKVPDQSNLNDNEIEALKQRQEMKEQGYDFDSILHQDPPVLASFAKQNFLESNVLPKMQVQIVKCYPYFSQFKAQIYLLATEQKFAQILSQINISYFKTDEEKKNVLLQQLEEYGNPIINKGLRHGMMVAQQIEKADFDKEQIQAQIDKQNILRLCLENKQLKKLKNLQSLMVVKTEVCNFSELKIYPGKGIRVITRDGKFLILSTHKSVAFHNRKTKGQVIRWTVTWRRLNKKMKTDKTTKRRKRKAQKVVKGIAGMDTEEIRRRQNESEQERLAQREKIMREIKERKRQEAQKKKKTNKKKNQFI